MAMTLNQEDLDAIIAQINTSKPFVTLADGVAHGGTPGSSTATIAAQQLYLKNSGDPALWVEAVGDSVVFINNPDGTIAVDIESYGGAGDGVGIAVVGDRYGIRSDGDCALYLRGRAGVQTHTGYLSAFIIENVDGGTESAFRVTAPDGHAFQLSATGANKHGVKINSDAGIGISVEAYGGNGVDIGASNYGLNVYGDRVAAMFQGDTAFDILGAGGTQAFAPFAGVRIRMQTGQDGNAIELATENGHGISIAATGSGKHGINVTSAAGSALNLNTDDGASTVYISNGGANQTGVDIQCTQSGSTGIYINSKDALVLASDGAGKYGIKSVLATGSLDTNFAGVGFLPNDGSAAMMLTSLAIANPSGAGLSIDGSTQGVNIQGADEGVNIQSSAGDGLRIAATGGNDVSLAGNSLIAGDFAAFPETYAADGATVKLSQALYEILAFLEERSTSSTTVTCKKRDGSTTALTLTLDSATQPTAITRST